MARGILLGGGGAGSTFPSLPGARTICTASRLFFLSWKCLVGGLRYPSGTRAHLDCISPKAVELQRIAGPLLFPSSASAPLLAWISGEGGSRDAGEGGVGLGGGSAQSEKRWSRHETDLTLQGSLLGCQSIRQWSELHDPASWEERVEK